MGENVSRDVCRLIRAGYEALSPLLSWWRYCVPLADMLAEMLSVSISGQNQAYAQALQYAYAPNMLTAQQLTAAGWSKMVFCLICSFEHDDNL